VVRLGSSKEIPIDVRLVCATNMPLYQMVNEGKFRQDLLYRINTVEIKLPALRERLDDIEPLTEHFLSNTVKNTKSRKNASMQAH
jgi:two-component system, NtrC family, response regulator HydG